MSRELFGTDGMRGKAGEYPLDPATVTRVGQAVGSLFANSGGKVIVGRDPRESSPAIVDALVDGLVAVGAKVTLAGVLPTPGLAYLTRTSDAAAGVMVTASHNPYSDNGIKVFKSGGQKLTDEEETELNHLIKNGSFESSEGSREQDDALVDKYVQFLSDSAKDTNLDGLKIAIDCANGAASAIAPKVFQALGAEILPMFDQPDGRNINEKCGATHPKALTEAVKSKRCDLGVALDGDADRVLLIDSQGREFDGDNILYLLAVRHNLKAVVTTVMSNYGLETALAGEGIELLRTPVGDRYVLDKLRETGLTLGGEQSGHIVLADLQPTGDGMLAAIQVLVEIKSSGKSLDRWRDEVETLPQAIVNLRVENKDDIANPRIQEFIKAQASALDGAGRLLVRPSGTEPVVRVMVEGPDAKEAAESIADELKAELAKL